MSTYYVDAVHKGLSTDRTHRHIEGVWAGGSYYDRATVVGSINAGHTWKTNHGGYMATIHPVQFCRYRTCMASPYIETNPDSTKADNLENLPEKE